LITLHIYSGKARFIRISPTNVDLRITCEYSGELAPSDLQVQRELDELKEEIR
jgi:hypothetical protein